jgi:hypothetical protein
MSALRFSSFFIALLLLQSCATMRSTNTYTIHLQSEPSGASIEVFDRKNTIIHTTQSPDSIVLKSGAGYFKRSDYTVTANTAGYLPATERIEFEVDKKYYLNFFTSFFMPVAFLIIDPITGAMWQPKEEQLFLKLEAIK